MKCYKAPVHNVQPRESRVTCKACDGDCHPSTCVHHTKSCQPSPRTVTSKAIICFNCLSAGHHNKDCRSSGLCHTCGKAHHTSFHRDPVSGLPAESSAVHTTAEQTSDTASANVTMPVNQTSSSALTVPTLQMTSQVDGRQLLARALLDSGASIYLVACRVVQQLKLKKQAHKLTLTGA